jgi:tetratricopeptide (TPR) repeat protein
VINGSEHEWTRRFCVAMLCCIVTAFNAHAIQGQAPNYMAFFRDATTEYHNHHFAAAGTLLGRALQGVPSDDNTTRAMILAQLGDVYVNQDDLIKAEDAYFQALSLYKGLSNKNQTALVLRNIGSILSLKGRQEEALRFLEHALKLARAEPADPKLTAEALNSLGIAYFRQHKNGKAEKYLNQAIETAAASGIDFDRAELFENLGVVLAAKHNLEKAEDLLKTALSLDEAKFGKTDPNVTNALAALAVFYLDAGRSVEAEAQFQRALDILEPDQMDFETRIARVLYGLSIAYAQSGRRSDGEVALGKAVLLARRNLNHPDMIEIVETYSSVLKNQGKGREADELGMEARRARLSSSLVINAHTPF